MPLRLDVKRTLTARSDRSKSVDLHPTEPWLLVCLYNGTVNIWNTESQTLIKTFEVCELPVRCGKFVARKNWVVTGSDDLHINVWNYNTLEKVHGFEAHSDYLRCLQVHPTQPFLLSSSDDMTIKLWNWDKKWEHIQSFEGHTHYVMQIIINPKDNNQFASASLDRTIKVWQLGSSHPNFTLEGHQKGVNSVDYFHGGDKPYLVSGGDDRLVKLWDYQTKTCVQTLEGHAQNVSCVMFHPQLPILLSGSEDGTVRVWHTNTHRLESTLNYGMQRVWTMTVMKGTNDVGIGYDEGTIMVKLGREEPAMSMDNSGKIIFAKHSDILQANLKGLNPDEIKDGEILPLAVKEMGPCEIYPQNLSHNPNGRFVVVCGDGEYIIYTAMALRNKSFGSAHEFVWSADSSEYAIRDNTKVKMFKNFKEKKEFKMDVSAEGIYGGSLLGVKSANGLSFYDWESQELIRRIDIEPKNVIWSETGEMCCITTEESFFVLKYVQENVAAALDNRDELVTEDGIEDAFQVLGEFEEVVKTGIWVGDCFIFTTSVNRLNYYVGGEIVTIAHLPKPMYLLGYIPKDDRLYLSDKELNVVSYHLLLSVLEYQTAVMRKDFETAQQVLPTIPKEQRNRVAHFLDKQGFKQQALVVSCDPEHKFELAAHLGDLPTAYEIAMEVDSEQKWKHLAELAIQKCEFALAQECLHKAQDFAGLLLLASCSGDAVMMEKLAQDAEADGKFNVSFIAYFSLGRLEHCLELLCKSDRLPEAAFLARTYLPSQVPRVVGLWKAELAKTNRKSADSLADPTQYSNLFPHMQEAIVAEEFLKLDRLNLVPAGLYPTLPKNLTRDAFEEVHQAQLNGTFQNIVATETGPTVERPPTDEAPETIDDISLSGGAPPVDSDTELQVQAPEPHAQTLTLEAEQTSSPVEADPLPSETVPSEGGSHVPLGTETDAPVTAPIIETKADEAVSDPIIETVSEAAPPVSVVETSADAVVPVSVMDPGIEAAVPVQTEEVPPPETEPVPLVPISVATEPAPLPPPAEPAVDSTPATAPKAIPDTLIPSMEELAIKDKNETDTLQLTDSTAEQQAFAETETLVPVSANQDSLIPMGPSQETDDLLQLDTPQEPVMIEPEVVIPPESHVPLESAPAIDDQLPIDTPPLVDSFVSVECPATSDSIKTAVPSDVLHPADGTEIMQSPISVESTTQIDDTIPVNMSMHTDSSVSVEEATSIDSLAPLEPEAPTENLAMGALDDISNPAQAVASTDNLISIESTAPTENLAPIESAAPIEKSAPVESVPVDNSVSVESSAPPESLVSLETDKLTDTPVSNLVANPTDVAEPSANVIPATKAEPCEEVSTSTLVEPCEVNEEAEEEEDEGLSDLDELDWEGDFDVDELDLDDLDNL